MKRRNFIQIGAIASSTPLLGLMGFASTKEVPDEKRKVVEGPFPLEERTVKQLQDAMQKGEYSSRKICQLYIDRIQEKDQSKGGLNSVIELNPDALDIADQMDSERRAGRIRGPLHGIPIMIKDNIDTGDKMMTTAGSLALVGNSAPDDAFIVKKLREAGLVLLGKTNLSEWANFRSFRSSSGWSGRGRQTNNPYALDRNPCGSSSGSGAAVSGNMCALTIGTETNGSIVCPASRNGVVGIKPTVGLWSRDGIIPVSKTLDTPGPMARTVADAAALLGVCVGVDEADKKTQESAGNFFTDYTQFLDANALKGKRIGLLNRAFGSHEKSDEILRQAIDVLKEKGAVIVEGVKLKDRSNAGTTGDVLLTEFKHGLNQYLASRSGLKVKTLSDIIAFNNENASEELPYFQQEIMYNAERAEPITHFVYKISLSKLKKGAKQYDKKLKKLNLDAFVALTSGPASKTDPILGDNPKGGVSSSSLAAIAGYPNITVPAGYVYGLPVGISFFSGKYQEPKLIAMAYAFEQATKMREAPKFLPSIDLI